MTQYLLVRAGGKRFSLPLDEVEGLTALRAGDISPLPLSAEGRVQGLFSHRGEVWALLRWEGETKPAQDASLTALLLRVGEKRFACLAEETELGSPSEAYPPRSALALYKGEAFL